MHMSDGRAILVLRIYASGAYISLMNANLSNLLQVTIHTRVRIRTCRLACSEYTQWRQPTNNALVETDTS